MYLKHHLPHWKIFRFLKKTNFACVFFSRGDHIVPSFEEIWPSKGGKAAKPKKGLEYYYDAMTNGPQLTGMRNILFLDSPNERMNRNLKECRKYLNSFCTLFEKYVRLGKCD